MNENPTAVDRPGADVGTPAVTQPELPRPWGFWSTLCWGLLAFGLWGAVVAGAIVWLNWGQIANLPDIQEDPWFPLQLTLANMLQIAVLAWAARLAGWPVGQYIGRAGLRPRNPDACAAAGERHPVSDRGLSGGARSRLAAPVVDRVRDRGTGG